MQATLITNSPKRRRSINITSNSLLTGMIYDGSGDRLTPIHSRKPNGRRYRYYISARLAKGDVDDGTALRLPAKQIEGHVIKKLTELLFNTSQLIEVTRGPQMTPYQISELEAHATELSMHIESDCHETQRTTLIDLVARVTIDAASLTLMLQRDALLPKNMMPLEAHDIDGTITLTYPLKMKRRGVETKLIIGGVALGQPNPDLIKLIAKSREWYEGLKDGSLKTIGDIAKVEKMDAGDVSRTLSLAFLAPSIIKDFLEGQNPIDLTMDTLRRKSSHLPLNWNEQRRYIGLDA